MAEANGRSYGVLVIDMQERYLEQMWDFQVRRIIANQRVVLEFCAEEDAPVVEVTTLGGGVTDKRIIEVMSTIPRRRSIQKKDFDGFTNINLESQLREWSISHLCVMGVYTSYCVLDTSRSARKNGFGIATSRGLTGNRKYKQKDVSWYVENGLYFKRTKDLIAHMRSN